MTTSQRRAAAANGDIDETLFATKKSTKRTGNATVISTEMLKKLSLDTGRNNLNPVSGTHHGKQETHTHRSIYIYTRPELYKCMLASCVCYIIPLCRIVA